MDYYHWPAWTRARLGHRAVPADVRLGDLVNVTLPGVQGHLALGRMSVAGRAQRVLRLTDTVTVPATGDA